MTVEPQPLPLIGVTLKDLARRHRLELVGGDGPISFLGLIRSSQDLTDVLTYVTSETYLDEFLASDIPYAVVERRFTGPSEKSFLVCPDELGEETFFQIHMDLAATGQVANLSTSHDPSARVHPTAVVMDHVRLGADCLIGPGAVVYPNTAIGARTVIKANSTIGGEGFEMKYIGERRTQIPHTGGVFIDDDATIGSSACVDRGLFGTFTRIGRGAKIDNLVHVAHNVVIGEDCAIVACAEISGSVRFGRGVWYGPSASCNHEIHFGDYSFVGTGSVVTRDVPAFTLVAGSPAKPLGHVCRCRSRVDLSDGSTVCPTCGTRLAIDAAGVVDVLEWGSTVAS
jgi:UDP-3-O-[3-hydroxymyristoyl] glucosamine N-acyltransferase